MAKELGFHSSSGSDHSSTDQNKTSFYYCRGFLNSSVPFDEVIRCLNGGYRIDLFNFGSIKIEDIPWPTEPKIKNRDSSASKDIVQMERARIESDKSLSVSLTTRLKKVSPLGLKKKTGACTTKYQEGCGSDFLIDDSVTRQILDRPLIDSDKYHNKKYKIPEKKEIRSLGVTKQPGSYTSQNEVSCPNNFLKDDESGVRRVLEKISGSDLPLDHSCSVQDKKSSEKRPFILPTTILRSEDCMDCSNINKIVSVSSTTLKRKISSVLGCPANKNDEENKLECSGRKMNKQYEEIENENKRRRIQVIEYQKPLVADQEKTGKRAKKVPLVKKLQSMIRNSQLRRMKPFVY